MTNKIGYWVDMENPYVTYHDDYIESEWWALKQMWDKGLLYQGHKVMPYCPRCGTALSSHEVAQGYKDVKDFFETAKAKGKKLALLSDFPPEQKDDVWGLAKLCDVVMGSESLGALKPSVYAFGQLAIKLGVPNERILYVGNSVKADIDGAKNAGMKAAYIQTGFSKIFNKCPSNADISFKNYRKLKEIVLK